MPITHQTHIVNEAFYQPMHGLATRSAQARPCPEFTDEAYLRCGVQRVLEDSASGRAFLQEHGPQLESAPAQGNYFATLHSARRHALLADVNDTLRESADRTLPNRLADISELATYVCFAVDVGTRLTTIGPASFAALCSTSNARSCFFVRNGCQTRNV